jgi:dolichol-phosphate mannosyltransferase
VLHLLLPAYNEAPALSRLLPRVRAVVEAHRMNAHVVIVDDGSADGTAEVASSYGVEVVRHERNLGLAAALRTGFAHLAREVQPDDVVVTMDADDSHVPGLIPRMIQRIDEGFDVVIASRFRPGARVLGVPAIRRLLSVLGVAVYRVLAPIAGVRDYTCGYRAYRASVLKQAVDRWGDGFVSETGFTATADVLLKLRHIDGVLMTELPFVLRYDRKPGASKMRVGANVRASVRLALRRARGRLD